MRIWPGLAFLLLSCSLDERVLTVTNGSGSNGEGGAGDASGAGASSNSSGGENSTGASSTGGTGASSNAGSGGSLPNGGSGGMPPNNLCGSSTASESQCSDVIVGVANALPIDDFEDPDPQSLPDGNRGGFWYVYDDMTGETSPEAGSPTTAEPVNPPYVDTSAFAMHFHGMGHTQWGAGLGVSLTDTGGNPFCYDAHDYTGVTFWARGNGKLKFEAQINGATGEPFGGSCACEGSASMPDCSCCGGYEVPVPLTGEWQQFTFHWNDLMQLPNVQVVPFEVSELMSLNFKVEGPGWDFWIDDIAFVAD
jgi:hypothetical protein